MFQKDFIIQSPHHIGKTIADIKKTLMSVPHKDALLTIYESGFPAVSVKGMIESLKAILGNEVMIAGLAVYAVADIPQGIGLRLNLLLTENADLEVVSIPCYPGDEAKASEVLRGRLAAHPNAKAVQLLVCNMGLNVTSFLEETMRDHSDLEVFGTLVYSSSPESLAIHRYTGFRLINNPGFGVGSYYCAIGDRIIDDGFVAVIYSGEDLRVQGRYSLGWNPVGRAMPVTIGPRAGFGETTLTEIDGLPAVEIFKEYLGVPADKYLISNICEFPLIIEREGINFCLIPFDYGDNGEIYLSNTVRPGETVRFSYASHDSVLSATKDSCEATARFGPQALYMVLCGNRINFLKEEARLEWDSFKKICPDLALIHGGSEIYYHNGRGGVLNSAHLVIAMREGDGPASSGSDTPVDIECLHHHDIIPLSERMAVFLSKMTDQLVGAAREARAASEAKSSFLSNMSHEIRTPINAIMGMDEMILRESSETGIIEYAEDIRSAGSSLLGIINDILDFSKIEAGKMDIIPVEYEFASVINDLYTMIHKRAGDKGLTLHAEVDPTIPTILYGDEIRIKQVITNILTNAVKYTEKGSITLTFKRMECPGDDLCRDGYGDRHGKACFANPVRIAVSVRDTGIGIREEDQKRLFGAFERVDEKRNRSIEGTGLGLNITRQLLNLMDSELKLESVYGEGSTFSFEIVQGISRDEPIGDMTERFRRQNSNVKKYHESFTAPDAKILLVDDTKLNLDVVINLLKKTRIQIDAVESGAEAVQMVRENAYDVIFLDHRMPQMDGIECLQIMRTMDDNRCPDAPVISLTANAVSGAREEYLQAGFADYLTKPIDPAKLEEMLIRYLPPEKVVKAAPGEDSKDAPRKAPQVIRGSRIALIDDEKMIHMVAGEILGRNYRFESYFSGQEAMEHLTEDPVDLILLDVKMPKQNGFEVFELLKRDERTSSIPVIFLTGEDSRETEIRGFNVGAWDFVRKPFVPEVLLKRVEHTIELSHLQKELEHEVAVQTLRADHLSYEVMMALSQAVDAKDHYTQGHSRRVAGYSVALAARMGMSEDAQADIYAMGLLHDVGKIGVHEEIINKNGKLTDEEFAQIKTHTVKGYDILKIITEMPGLATGARWHHEKYNGTGYPDGIAGEEIPLEARIICVADSYDAMTSKRSYSNVREHTAVRAEIERCAGTQFDPGIAKVMLEMIDEDKDYKMNELGYAESRVSAFAEKLVARNSGKIRHMQSSLTADAGNTAVPDMSDEADEPEVSIPDWLTSAEGIDVDTGIANCGSAGGFMSVLQTFASTVREKADEIQRYYDEEDWKDYTVKVHALKSSARIIGAKQLSEQAAALEAAGDALDTDRIRSDTPGLLELFRSYIDILAPMNDNDRDLPPASDTQIADAYAAVSEFAANMDYDLTLMVLDSMKEYSLPDEDSERFRRIRTALSQLDWESIRKEVT